MLVDESEVLDRDAGTPTTGQEDQLGYELQKKFETWKTYRVQIEREWLKDLRAYNQIPEEIQQDDKRQPLTTYHGHIYSGMARSRADTACARLVDPLFQGAEKHWRISPTPMPEYQGKEIPDLKIIQEQFAVQAQSMEKEMEDQLFTMGYEERVKAAIQEATVIGTGVVKGVVPGIRRVQSWVRQSSIDQLTGITGNSWEMITDEVPYPSMGDGLSIFDTFPDPFAMTVEEMSGCFQRHVLNRGLFEALIEDEQFDKSKIREILRTHDHGNHTALYHETERRKIAGITDTSGSSSDRYDVLEYWGQVSGKLLQTLGLNEAEDESETYWCCVWTCAYKTILARLMPMRRKRLPFNFFQYARVPHQFWGISPIRMIRKSSLPMQNAALRALCDDLTYNVLPMSEVNTQMLRDGEDPRAIGPGHRFLRDRGDPAEPAIRWYSPESKVNAILPALDVSRRSIDEETNIPSYTQGMQIKGANETASGTSMLMGAADIQRKSTIRNLEDGLIRPLITSLYDWNMQWNPREDIKGDMGVEVKGITSLVTKEVQSQRLLQFISAVSSNPMIAPRVDWDYIARETAKSLEIDPDKAIPEPEQQPLTYEPQYPQSTDAVEQPSGMEGVTGELYGPATGEHYQ